MYDLLAQLSLSNSAFLAKNFKLHNWSVFDSYFTATPFVGGGKISNNDVTMFVHDKVVSKSTLTPSKTSLSAKSLIWCFFKNFFSLLERFCSWPHFESEDSMDHLHDGVILLLRPESFSFLLSYFKFGNPNEV